MYKQKLTLDPKLSEVCEATLTVYDPEPLNEEAATEAVNFTVVGSGVISAEEKAAHQKMRAVAPLAAGEKDVAITSLECVSIDGDVLPAEFQMTYEFHIANFSDEAIASVPVTIYFNTPNSDLVAQGTTTVSNIPAGHYQALQFAFPGVVAGAWMMSLEANQPRAFEESNYSNNLLSKTFTYVNRTELVAEEVSVVTDDPVYDSSGRPIIFYDTPTTLDFCVSNISPISVNSVLLQVPAAFQDSTGAYSTMLTEGKIDMPANTRRHAQLNITFTKPATAQIGLVLNSDRAYDEVSYDNNETSQEFLINKYNPGTKNNYLTYPTTTMRITQPYDGPDAQNHLGNSTGTPADYPIDEGCEDEGRSWFYCPCDEMEVVHVYLTGSNTVWLESTSPVTTPTGVYDTITLMVTHPENEDLDGINGKIFKRGEPIFREGKDGWASGNHFHISVGTGNYNGAKDGTGWEKNSSGEWVLTPTGKTLKPEEAFYIDPDFTEIEDSAGITFELLP